MRKSYNRRSFLKTSAAGTAVVAGYTATARGYQANETLNVGCIGTGGRCRRLMKSLVKVAGVRIAAVCDVWDAHLEEGRKLADPKAFSTKIFEEVLERSDIDAVLIGSPDHWHVPMTIAACEAGKDVYVEKPLTHHPSEGAAVIEAQNHNRRIVQVGMQQRSMPQVQKAREILRSGQLGKIHKVHLSWNRNTPRGQGTRPEIDPGSVDWKRFLGSAPDQPFDPYRFRQWRWFWDFGGGLLTDLMVHHIDIANWFLDLENPARAVTVGDHFRNAGLWETPETIQTLIRYPDQDVQVYFEGTFSNARSGAMFEFMGTEATLYVDRGRYEIHPERGREIPYSEWVLGEGRRGADFYTNPDGDLLHLTNWIESVRSRQKPIAPAEAGVAAAAPAHLGNRAYLNGGIANAV